MAALDSLLGNETLKESLSAALAAGRLSHSILLCGEAGTGAGFAARCLAADSLYPNGGASAAQVLAGQSPEYLLLAGGGRFRGDSRRGGGRGGAPAPADLFPVITHEAYLPETHDPEAPQSPRRPQREYPR